MCIRDSPKAIVQIVHGMCEYKERYLDFINFLNKNGYIVIIHDLRGHGKSILTKDDLGYFYQDGARAVSYTHLNFTSLFKIEANRSDKKDN